MAATATAAAPPAERDAAEGRKKNLGGEESLCP